MLVLVNVFDSICFEQASPEHVPVRASCVLETRHFERVYYTVVGVSCLGYFERKLHAGLQLILIVLDYPSVVLW